MGNPLLRKRLLAATILGLAAISALVFVLTASGSATRILIETSESPFSVHFYNIGFGVVPTLLWLVVLTGLWLSERPGPSRKLLALALAAWGAHQVVLTLPPLLSLIPNSPAALLNLTSPLYGMSLPLSIAWPLLFCYGIARSPRFSPSIGRLALVWAWAQTVFKLTRFIAGRLDVPSADLVSAADRLVWYVLPLLVIAVLVGVGLSLMRQDDRQFA